MAKNGGNAMVSKRWREPLPRPRHSVTGHRGEGIGDIVIHNRPPGCYIMAVSGMSKNGGFPKVFANAGDGFELSLKIQPKENYGFSGLAISGIVPQPGAK
jgi:hypothetical protein